jgi:hypothetical protein
VINPQARTDITEINPKSKFDEIVIDVRNKSSSLRVTLHVTEGKYYVA